MEMIKLLVVMTAFVCLVIASNEADYPSDELPIGVALPQMNDDDSSSEESEEAMADPTPCCFPKQWQGNVTGEAGFSGGRKGGGNFGQSSSMVFVDQDAKCIAGRSSIGRFRNRTGGFVVKFGANDTADAYFFDMSAQKCMHKKLNKAQFRQQCIPANATYGGSFSLGSLSAGLQVQSWSFRGKSKPQDDRRGGKGEACVGGKVLVIPTGCIPVFIQDHGMVRRGPPRPPHVSNTITFTQNSDDSDDSEEEQEDRRRPGPKKGHHGKGGGFVASAYFSNVEPSIKDPTVFTPPTYCNATMSSTGLKFSEEDFRDVLSRFIDY